MCAFNVLTHSQQRFSCFNIDTYEFGNVLPSNQSIFEMKKQKGGKMTWFPVMNAVEVWGWRWEQSFVCFENQFLKNVHLCCCKLLMFVVCGEKIGKFFGKPHWRKSILKVTFHGVLVGMLFKFSFQILRSSNWEHESRARVSRQRVKTSKISLLNTSNGIQSKMVTRLAPLIEFFHRNRVKFHAPLCSADF